MNSDTLYQLLECPICYGSMKPPIRQCKIGHTFCNSCRLRITSCPICRGGISSSRAFHLEKISQTTEICKKCNKSIPLHCSLAHKDSCLNGSGDTIGERLESNSELDNHIQTTELHSQQRINDNFYSSSSSSSVGSSDANISILHEDSTDPDNFSDNYMVVADSSENYVSSSDDDDDGQNKILGDDNIFSYDTSSSDEAEGNVSNEDYDAGNDGDESGEAESSEEEEDNVDENDEADAEVEFSEDEYYDDDDDDDDIDDNEEEEVSEEEVDVSSEPGSYFSDDGPQLIYESDNTGSEENGDSCDCFFTTDEYDASD